MNVKNAYVKIGSTSSKNSAANGEFTLNFENSIAEFTNQLTFAEPTNGMNPTFNLNVKDSVLTTGTKLIIAAPNTNAVIDNSIVTLATYFRNSGNLKLINKSVLTGSTIQFGENGGNDGTTIVDNSTFNITASSEGHALDGKDTGSIILLNGATASVDYVKSATIIKDKTSVFSGNALENAVVSSGLRGEGTKANPYLISNLAELEYFRDDVNAGNNYAGKYVKLTADIDLEGKNWAPIGTSANPFNGNFDGDNKVVSNLVINGSTNYVSGGNNDNYIGLFGYSNHANTVIKNITINNAKVTGCLYVGALIGRVYTGAKIENCHVTGEVDIDSYSYAGGLVGRYEYASGIYGCSVVDTSANGGTVNADYAVSYVGGLVGFTSEGNIVIDDCNVENMAVSGIYGVGGMAGIAHYGVTISDATVSKVTVTSDQTGYDDERRTGNVGLVAGACQGTEANVTVFENITVTESTGSVTNEEGTTEVKDIFGSNMQGIPAVTNYVAKGLITKKQANEITKA